MLPKNKEPSTAASMLSGNTRWPSMTTWGGGGGRLGAMDAQPVTPAVSTLTARTLTLMLVLLMC